MEFSDTKIEFFLPNFKKGQFQTVLNRIAKKSNKLVLPELQVEFNDGHRKYEILVDREEHQTKIYNIAGQWVTVTGQMPIIDGWQVIGVVHYDQDQVYAQTLEGFEMPKHYHEKQAITCNHCNKPRSRKISFVLQNKEGETMLLGSTCVKDFTGLDDAFYALESAKALDAAALDEFDFEMCRASIRFTHEEIILDAIRLINVYGYHKYDAAYPNQPTKAMLFDLHHTREFRDSFNKVHPLTDKQRAKFKGLMEWAKNIEPNYNDYLINIQKVCTAEHVHEKMVGVAVSIPVAYERHLQRVYEQQQTANTTSEYQGELKQRMRGLNLEVTDVRTLGYNGWNTTILFTFKDESNNVYVWFCSSADIELERGDKVTLDGTVKEHKAYKETKQTVLTRCKLK